jgi:hypothetical protein
VARARPDHGPVTHDSSIARRAQRIGVMKNGRLGFKQPSPSPD